MFSENELEEVAFLWLFPYGVNGLKTNRKPTISVLQHFQNRLLCKENRWRKNATYIFWVLSMHEQHKLQECISIAVRKSSICDPPKGQSKRHNSNQKFSLDHNIIDSSYTFIRQILGELQATLKMFCRTYLQSHCHLSPKGALSFKTLVLSFSRWSCVQKLLCNCRTHPTCISYSLHALVLLSTWCKHTD